MPGGEIETDYLIVGSGAVGMAFADTLLTDTDDDSGVDMVIVDRHPLPGGHWNDAYPFVTLHQPSAFYGVNSRELSTGLVDETGWNQGLGDLATGAEISAYYDQVMRHRLLPSGRVRYYPMCEYDGDGSIRPLLGGRPVSVSVRRRLVDTTHLATSVPSTHTPSFPIAEGVRFLPINALPQITDPPDDFVVVGGGKTGIDACLWLLEKGVDPDRIRWVMPRDAWLLDRRNTQAGPEFFLDTFGAQAAQLEAVAAATSVEDLFDRLEKAGVLVRIDESVQPRMFHAATISQAELEQLRRLDGIVRLGRVRQVDADRITLDDAEIPLAPGTVVVDCSARAIADVGMKPIFADGLITPQTVRGYQPVFSAALIAHVEATRDTDTEKNQLCQVVPLPDHDTDWIRMMIPHLLNQYTWSRDPDLRAWLLGSRLDGFSAMARSLGDDPDRIAVMRRLRDAALPAMEKLLELSAEIETSGAPR